MRGCLGFFKIHDRWPMQLSEVMDVLKADGLSTDNLSQLEWVEFEITGEDILEIKYKAKGLTEAYISLEKPHSAYVQ
jgi:hypothetical protein